jgi:hypothetical protein
MITAATSACAAMVKAKKVAAKYQQKSVRRAFQQIICAASLSATFAHGNK